MGADCVRTGSEDRWLFAGIYLLTLLTGLIDAACFLGLGRVFTGNMTGNFLLLGYATTGVPGLAFVRNLIALGAFVVGAVLGAFVVGRRTRRCGSGFIAEWLLLAAALSVVAAGQPDRTGVRAAAIVLLGLAMGVQSSTVRRMGIRDANTQVLTTALGGLVVDSVRAGGPPARGERRLATVLLLFAGAALGAVLERHGVKWAVLGALVDATLAVVVLAGSGTLRSYGSERPFSAPPPD